jgi:serine/threonine protein kinase
MATGPPMQVLDERYEVGDVIGRGAMGVVHLGYDRRLGREVAVKFLRPDLAADPRVRARFEHEARAAARLSHPAIVTVFDSGEHEGVPYLVMERLPGTSLADELEMGPIAPNRVGVIARRVAGALAAAHAVGVVHRDVKPGNLLLTDQGEVKLADFGIATSGEAADHTATGMVVGTPAYLAPERLAGKPATPGTDVYSLGVVLYEALTGAKPFEGDSPVVVAHAMHSTTPTPIAVCMPQVDRTLAAAIERAMAKDPVDRPTTGAELSAALDTGLAPTVVSPTAPGAATAAMPLDGTRPMDAGPDLVGPALRNEPGVRRQAGGRHRVVAIAVVVAAAIIGVAWLRDGSTGTPPTTTATTPTAASPSGGSALPGPLEGAITRLEHAVQP